tara:strand:- start:29 stop:322 length:294 start_codon:yes stop_codon:yes gene_type:complete
MTSYLYIHGYSGSFLIDSNGIVTDTVKGESYSVNDGSFSPPPDITAFHHERLGKAYEGKANLYDLSLLDTALEHINEILLEVYGARMKALEVYCGAD